MVIEQLRLRSFLSFGPAPTSITLGPLNVLIGPNGSGKSNFIEALRLLRSTPRDFQAGLRAAGGATDLIWKDPAKATPSLASSARIELTVRSPVESLSYALEFQAIGHGSLITEEKIEGFDSPTGATRVYYGKHENRVLLWAQSGNGAPGYQLVDTQMLKPWESVLSQFKDPFRYPQLQFLDRSLSAIQIFSVWSFGPQSPVKLPQQADLPNDYLAEDGSNLGLVLNKLKQGGVVRRTLLENAKLLYEGIDDVDVKVEAGTVQVFFLEGNRPMPASRLSDGTLHWLCLLAVLLHPDPPHLICMEEPELGLHPDLLPALARLMEEASQRTQLIVTTHSDVLVDALSHLPDAVLVCEKGENGTSLRRLSRDDLGEWLQNYSLGQLWRSGEIGGNRW